MAPLSIALRTDKCFSETLSFLEEKGCSGWCVKETVEGENEHWHWYLETDAYKNIRAFRVALTRGVEELKGNGAYSAKETDEFVERYWQYMAKGEGNGVGCQVVWRHGLLWTDDRIEELHQAYWAENRAKRQKLPPIEDVVLEKAKAAGLSYDDIGELLKIYIKELFVRDKPINLFSARSRVNLISLKLAPDVDSAVSKLVDNGRLL